MKTTKAVVVNNLGNGWSICIMKPLSDCFYSQQYWLDQN
jgi:hypothetical protein